MIHNFLARLGISSDARVERREVELSPGKTYPLFTVSEDAWTSFGFVVDGESQDFERITLGDHWLAFGTIDDVAVAIEGHHFGPDRLELVRLDRGSRASRARVSGDLRGPIAMPPTCHEGRSKGSPRFGTEAPTFAHVAW
jgi:hypothetical protein